MTAGGGGGRRGATFARRNGPTPSRLQRATPPDTRLWRVPGGERQTAILEAVVMPGSGTLKR